jgi:endo-1,4-beta-xylanase
MGAAVDLDPLLMDPDYRETLEAQYGSITPENAMKFGIIHPALDGFDFEAADAIMAFAASRSMAVHGHTLLWHEQQPAWLQEGAPTREFLMAELESHVATVVGRYANAVASWDVANEVIAPDGGGLRETFWTSGGGADVVDSAFVWARRADPDAELFLNDTAVETIGPKSDALLALAVRLRDAGVPIDGVGFQAHLTVPGPSREELQANMARFAAAGFDIRITELDVRIPDGTDLLAEQAEVYADVIGACLAEPRCRGVTTWGFTDRYSWIPGFYPGFGRALPFDSAYVPKPAYEAMARSLAP